MADDRYEERYCAYVDILGFTQLIADLSKDPSKFIDIQQVLQKVHQPERVELSPPSRDRADFQAQSISDAVAISAHCNAIGILSLIVAVQQLVRSLLREGYFTRGAICRGKLYHDDKMVFGEALIKAHQLESEVARYPRVMLTKAVVDDVMGYQQPIITQHITQGDDGPYFLHVLRPLYDHLEGLKGKSPGITDGTSNVRTYDEMRSRIMQRFLESVDTPRHFEKVKWFADYWNRTVDPIGGRYIMHIDGPGLPNYLSPLVDNSIR